MKKFIVSAILLLLSTLAFSQDKEGHSLVGLWKSYYKTEKEDKPQEQIDLLERIRAQAAERHLAWDFYDAGEKLYDLSLRTNWKLADSLRNRLVREAEEYGAAIVGLQYKLRFADDDAYGFIERNRAELLSGQNRIFYRRFGYLTFGKALPTLLDNDYEYGLWSLYADNYYNSDSEKYRLLLEEYYQGRYPLGALAEFAAIERLRDKDKLTAFEKQYGNKAAGILAAQELLSLQFDELELSAGKEQNSYLKLKVDCESLIKKARSFLGSEREIASCYQKTENILRLLEDRNIYTFVDDGTLNIILKNIPEIEMVIYDNKENVITRESLRNARNSYYLEDTLRYKLDEGLADGRYEILCSENRSSNKEEYRIVYDKYSLAIALRQNSGGIGIFVADNISGEPIGNYSLFLFDSNGTKTDEVQIKSSKAFTAVPETLQSKITGRRGHEIQAAYTDSRGTVHLSPPKGIFREEIPDDTSENDREERISAVILSDRKAYNQGDTLHCKAIAYSGYHSYRTLPEGELFRILLKDRNGKIVYSESMNTNEFGSCATSISIASELEGGTFMLCVEHEGKQLNSTGITIDEFVLPSFNLVWGKSGTFLPGDIITLGGNIKSYSGHSVADAGISYTVSANGENIAEDALETDAEGNFTIEFQSEEADRYLYYIVSVKVIEATGETLEFTKSVYANPYVSVQFELKNAAEGDFHLEKDFHGRSAILDENTAVFSVRHEYEGMEMGYELLRDGKNVDAAAMIIGDNSVDFSNLESGLYEFVLNCSAKSDSGAEYKDKETMTILKIKKSDNSLNDDIAACFYEVEGKSPAIKIGSTSGTVWVAAELYGKGNVLLDQKLVRFVGQKSRIGSMKTVSFPLRNSYPENLCMKLLFFKNGRAFTYTKEFRNEVEDKGLALRFTRMLDTTLPSRHYSFSIQTESGVECAASIFDVSTENIRSNIWRQIPVNRKYYPSVHYDISTGYYRENGIVPFSLANTAKLTGSSRAALQIRGKYTLAETEEDSVADAADAETIADVDVRENFANTLAWEPFLRSDDKGNMDLAFSTSDKLSTYRVLLFAHNKDFRNAVISKDFTVTLPVKISIAQPQFLYEGDKYVARVSVSNSLNTSIAGKVAVQFGDNMPVSRRIIIDAMGSGSFDAEVSADKIGELVITASFIPDNADYGSDAVRVAVPVKPASQQIVEAHSALLRDGDDKNELIALLRSRFVNMSADNAEIREISIRQLLDSAMVKELEIKGEDALSLSAVLYVDSSLGGRMDNARRDMVCRKLLECRNGDGGFGWFVGMNSSPVITAALLERFASMEEHLAEGLKAVIGDAVRYLDRSYFSEQPLLYWRGHISLAQYLHVRSLYADVTFSDEGISKKTMKAFRKEAAKYLTPRSERGLNGMVFDKVRRARTLLNLISASEGKSLVAGWGVRLLSDNKLRKSLDADILSLSQYAVGHYSGGIYFPNAVMPYRGLLEDELYAHSMICSLMDYGGYSYIAEGIRLWIMVQKESQDWELEPGYADALACVSKASDATLDLRVVALSVKAELAFGDIQASGNGYEITAEYLVGDRILQDGDKLSVGDKIVARYTIWSSENRSFVKLTLPRPAALRPLQQLSGPYGWRYGAYRSVRADRTEIFFESYPEEKSVSSEEFFVTQEGVFRAPAAVVESLYAPHYRANGVAVPDFSVE